MLGEKIRNYILSSGLKIGSVAIKSDIPFNVFSAMLNGKRSIKAEEYFNICSALNVPLDKFATWGEIMILSSQLSKKINGEFVLFQSDYKSHGKRIAVVLHLDNDLWLLKTDDVKILIEQEEIKKMYPTLNVKYRDSM